LKIFLRLRRIGNNPTFLIYQNGRKSSLNDTISSIELKSAEFRPSEEVVNDHPAPTEFENDTFEIITYSSNDEGF
jgi:hypothetical protein